MSERTHAMEMTWNVGDRYWQAELQMRGETIIDTPRRRTRAAARMDAWGRFHDLTQLEGTMTDAVACEYIVTSVDGNNIVCAESTGETATMSQVG